VPNAAVNTLSRHITPSDHQNGNTYVGRLNGDRTADCPFAKCGRPSPTCGFQSGTSGSRSRV
jgi:hypothetical protein